MGGEVGRPVRLYDHARCINLPFHQQRESAFRECLHTRHGDTGSEHIAAAASFKGSRKKPFGGLISADESTTKIFVLCYAHATNVHAFGFDAMPLPGVRGDLRKQPPPSSPMSTATTTKMTPLVFVIPLSRCALRDRRAPSKCFVSYGSSETHWPDGRNKMTDQQVVGRDKTAHKMANLPSSNDSVAHSGLRTHAP